MKAMTFQAKLKFVGKFLNVNIGQQDIYYQGKDPIYEKSE